MKYERGRLGLYVHIPFCASKCAYCDFYSMTDAGEELYGRYTDALIKHMTSYKKAAADFAPDTVFIGGGTPTVLPGEYLFKIISAIKRNFAITKNAEFTVEANPATVNLSMLKKLRRAGVNRLSLGLQSAHNNELAALSRIHKREDFEASYRAAREAGFDNINVDLMFGIPYQTKQSLLHSINYLSRIGVDHISLYDLKLEPGTPFYENRRSLPLPDEDSEADMYLAAVDFLDRRGYAQYEISNFARPGKMCLHNIKYWNCDDYLGFGPSAHSFFNGNRFSFVRDIGRYMAGIEDITSKINVTDSFEEISPKERIGEYVMLRMRLCEGVRNRDFFLRFGKDFNKMYGAKLDRFVRGGYVRRSDEGYALTPAGMFVSNAILSDILSFEDLGVYSFDE